MSEFRQNLATHEWVIIQRESGVKAESLRAPRALQRRTQDPNCPFCPGNESRTPKATYAVEQAGRWTLRAFPSGFSLVTPAPPPVQPPSEAYKCVPARGLHQIVVETPSHADDIARLPLARVKDLMHAYHELFDQAHTPETPLVTIYKNHGASAGTTLEHSHSVVIAAPVVPEYIRSRMDRAYSYYNATGGCVMCRMNGEEKRLGERVLVETERHIAYCLYASLSPIHIWIVPKTHTPTLLDSEPEDLDDLAFVLKQVAARVALGLGDPDFNYMLMIYPQDEGSSEALHWHLSFVVRSGPPRGFELGSRIFVNPVVPEEAAAYLRGVSLPKEVLA